MYKSMAPNLSLQNLVEMANDKNQDYLAILKQKRDQMAQDGKFHGGNTLN